VAGGVVPVVGGGVHGGVRGAVVLGGVVVRAGRLGVGRLVGLRRREGVCAGRSRFAPVPVSDPIAWGGS
jgi:hypothetical protein